ncbi:MAG: UDP-N-acetylglucosamine 2-epimerase (non-hydrolyzing) [Chitinophagaceae bacterium]|nr:MAG: UDP-N-acetylglucosamine 2-epimerase (non-hydrolyzing) [Chitinophagaceae bacterium]
MKIISIIGARPQFIKHAPVSLALKNKFQSLSIHTGQHYDENMSKVFFDEMKIDRPDFMLDMGKATRHGAQTAVMLQQIEEILINEKPGAVLLYGDTNSTVAGALAAAKLGIGIIHIEAGLRSYNRHLPEEINRVMTDHLSQLLFAPTANAVENLKKEGITKGVFQTGDVMCDAVRMTTPYLQRPDEGNYYFVTLHRPYNTDEPERLRAILTELNGLGKKVIFSIHPRTSNNMSKWGMDPAQFANLQFIPPVGYRECLSYQTYCDAVITDSGGIQKEAYMLHKKAITLRSETEWIETMKGGANTLVFDNLSDISRVLGESNDIQFEDAYGDGHAAEETADIIAKNISLLTI